MSPEYKSLEKMLKQGISIIGGRSSLGLQYGDIIKISAPSNEKINGRIFFIDYIDHEWIRCIDISQPDEKYSYKIEWDEEEKEGFLIDTSIEQISLINRGDDLGYVKINNLQKDDTLIIEWAIPQMPQSRVKIQDIVLDAIEIIDLETKDILYIDFEYKGIPEYIEKIRVISGIEGPLEKTDEPIEEYFETEEQPVEIGQSALQLLSKQGDAVLREIVSMNDVSEDLDAIEMEMEIPENQQRYTLDVQIEDVSDHLYSRFPKHLHTPELGIEITKQINRFVELRQKFSDFQENGIILSKKTETRPIVKKFIQETDNFPYRVFTPVVQLKKKVYVECLEEQEQLLENPSFQVNDESQEIISLEQVWEKYRKNVQQGDENKLVHLIRNLYQAPFLKPSIINDKSLFHIPIKTQVPQEYWTAEENDPYFSLHLQVINSKKREECSIYDINKISYVKQRFLNGEEAFISAIYVPDIKTIMNTTTPRTPFFEKLQEQTLIPEEVRVIPLKKNDKLFSEYDERIFINFQKPTAKNKIPPIYGSKPTCFYIPKSSNLTMDKLELLQTITPTTSYLLQILKHEGILDKVYSFQQVIEKMAGWAINQENITITEAREINLQIEKNIRMFMKEWRTRSGDLLKKAQQVFAYYKPSNVRWNDLYNLFSSSPEGQARVEQMRNAYQIDFETFSAKTEETTPVSNSEILKIILSIDNGRLFHLCLISLLLDWLSPEQFLSGIPDISNTGSNDKTRAVLKTLSKKYTTELQIEKDNDKETAVFVDDDLLDSTTKDWIRKFEPVLKKAKTDAEKREIVFQTLTDVDLMSSSVAEEMTNTIISGKKRVEDGDYAVLEIKKRAITDKNTAKDVVMTRQYYKRIQGIWNYDKSLKDEDFGEDIGNLLQSLKTKNQPVEIKKAIQFEFERRYSKIAETMKEQINEDIETQIRDIIRKREWNKNRVLSLNRVMTKQVEIYEEEKNENPVISPYASLRDLLLVQNNEQKRQYDIVRFFQQYCRKATLTENQNWGYCKLTNTRLFPISIYELAVVYNTGKTRDYNRKLTQVCSTYGIISDDGGSWVDRESGYTICLLEQVADGSDSLEYRRLAIAEQEMKEAEIQTAIETLFSSKTENAEEEEKNDVVSVLFRFLNKQTGIKEKANSPLFNEINVLYQNTIIDPRIIISAKKYKASLAQKYSKYSSEELANKIRSEPPYEIYLDRMHVYVAVSSYFAVLQIHRKELKRSNMGGPVGCTFTLKGYPQNENPDKDEGIRYMACLLQDTAKIDERPWKSMNQQSQTVMVKNIKVILQNMISNTPSLKNALKTLGETGEENENQINDFHNTWSHFLPPIVPFSVKKMISGEENTHRLLLDEYNNSRKNKIITQEKLKGLGSLLTYGIVERINDIVLKKKMLMKTMNQIPFLENTCCNDRLNRSRNPIFYFCQEDPSLLKYIQISRQLNQDIEKIYYTTISPLLFYKGLTWGTTFETSSPVIQESTIKMLFIYFLYDKGVWNRTDIQSIFTFPAPTEGYNREWSSIKKMAMFQEIIEKTGKWSEIRPLYKRFIQKMNQDRIKPKRQEQDTIQLRTNRQTEFNEILEIFRQNGPNTLYSHLLEETGLSITVKQIIAYRKPLLVHLEMNGITIPPRFLTLQEETPIKNNIINLKNALYAFITFLPQSIIQNKENVNSNVPKHWVFTDSDLGKIMSFIDKNTIFYLGGQKTILKPLLSSFVEKGSIIKRLIDSFPEDIFNETIQWTILSYLLVETVYLHLETYYEINASSQETEMKKILKDYLRTSLEKMDKCYSFMEMSYEKIRQNTQIDADTEKNTIKQYLKEMTNEERKVENEMKKHKIGRWNVGKEIFIYDKRKQGVGFETQAENDEEIVNDDEEIIEEEGEDGYDVDEGYDDNGDEEGDFFED